MVTPPNRVTYTRSEDLSDPSHVADGKTEVWDPTAAWGVLVIRLEGVYKPGNTIWDRESECRHSGSAPEKCGVT